MFFRKRLFLTAGVLLLILLGIIFFGKTSAAGRVQDGFVALIRPFIRLREHIRFFSSPAFGGNEDTQQKIKALSFDVEQLKEENERLQNALGFQTRQKIFLTGADVLFEGRELGKEFLVISQGKNKGIEEGDSVIDSNGFFMGVVREVGGETAKVVVASNSGETQTVDLLPGTTRALAKGVGNRTFVLELVEGEAVVRPGDFVVLPGPRPTALLMAEVASVKRGVNSAFQEVQAILLARPERAREVFVVKNLSLR